MIWVALIFNAALLALLAYALLYDRLRRRSSRIPRVGHRVTVHTKKPDDQTIFGVMVGDYRDRIVLEDAEYVTPLGGKSLPGTQHVATENIAWIDVHALVSVPDAVQVTEKGHFES